MIAESATVRWHHPPARPPRSVQALPAPPAVPASPVVVVVPPDAVPEGAVVLAVVAQLPGPAGPVRPLQVAPEPPTGLHIDVRGRVVQVDGEVLELTRREFDLLAFAVERPRRVLSRPELLAGVWGHDDPRYVGARTVDVHVARLRRKLGRAGGSLQTLRGVGYRWVP